MTTMLFSGFYSSFLIDRTVLYDRGRFSLMVSLVNSLKKKFSSSKFTERKWNLDEFDNLFLHYEKIKILLQ